jgi:hypothetical protein
LNAQSTGRNGIRREAVQEMRARPAASWRVNPRLEMP